jgi:hypothetical protein
MFAPPVRPALIIQPASLVATLPSLANIASL